MPDKKNEQKQEQKQEQVALATTSERFVSQVERQFAAEIGNPMDFTKYEKTLAQHLFLKIDSTFKDLEAKRSDVNKPAYVWANVNMTKLALDAVHRVNLGLDALITGHIYPIPYLNGKTKQYDVDLRIGYVGKDYYRRQNAVEQPEDIRYELVYSTDKFRPIMKSFKNKIESYEFEVVNPFDRGEVIGGFGYIMFENPTKNKLIIVTDKDFKKSENLAQSQEFWKKHKIEMQFKTLVNRVTDKLQLDPKSVNAASYAYVESQENDAESKVEDEIRKNANKVPIDVDFKVEDEEAGVTPAVENQSNPEPEQQPEQKHELAKNNKSQQMPLTDEAPY